MLARIEELERETKKLKDENETMKREKQLNFDRRLNFFASNVKGSHSYRSKSSNGSTGEKQQMKKLITDAKNNAKDRFTDGGKFALRCVICNSFDLPGTPIAIAHIVSSAMSDYGDFGVENGYKDDLDVFSVRNYMPLCGAHGQEGTCHDAMDKHLIHIRCDSLSSSYHVDCAKEAPQHFHDLSELALTTPPGWNPYRRLLAWRSRKCGTEYGFTPDFGRFEAMNQISENSNSVGDADDDESASTAIAGTSEMDAVTEKRPRLK